MAKPETYFLYTSKPRRLVCRIHRPTKKGTYYLLKPLRRRRGQFEYVTQISLVGFTSLPSGLSRTNAASPRVLVRAVLIRVPCYLDVAKSTCLNCPSERSEK